MHFVSTARRKCRLHFAACLVILLFVVTVIDDRAIGIEPDDVNGSFIVFEDPVQILDAALFLVLGDRTGNDTRRAPELRTDLLLHALVI